MLGIISQSAHLFFYSLVALITVHTVFLAYHWFTYGEKKRTATIALTVYLAGIACFFIGMALTLPHV